MPRFAANLSLLFTELPYLDRFGAAAEAGFKAVEILFPYDIAAKDTRRALLSNGLELVLINAPPPNYTGGDRGFAAIPGGQARFQHDIARAGRYAQELHATFIHVMAGVAQGDDAKSTFVENLRWAADQAPKQHFTIEPLNQIDQPGYFLSDFDLAVEVLNAVNRPNVGLQYDTYHAQMIVGDALGVWNTVKDRVTHVQIGSAPGRHEPGIGPMDFAGLFNAFDADGYTGWVSAEYNPSALTQDCLGWMARSPLVP
jgi:hydroxypyruvate isomerase